MDADPTPQAGAAPEPRLGDRDLGLAVPPTPGAKTEVKEGEVRLAREITLADATLMGVGALMGGGVFVLLGLATSVSGNAVLLALFLNGFITIPTLMVYADLGAASDDAGGGYLWVKQALGQPLGFLGGWLGWFSHVIACSLYSIASAAFIVAIVHYANPAWLPDSLVSYHPFPSAPWFHVGLLQVLAVALAGLFVGLNYLGVKIGIRTENVINSLVLVVVVGFIGAGLWALTHHADVAKQNLEPFFPPGGVLSNLSNVFLAMGITFIAFEGYEIISQTGEEIQNPRRNVPRAIWSSFLIVWVVMLLVALVALGATRVPPALAAEHGWTQSWPYLGSLKQDAIVQMANQVMPYGTLVLASAALLLQLTALNATIYSSSRVSFAMGRDRNLPRFFSRVHAERRTPHYAVLGSGLFILVMALLPIETVATSADVMFLLLFLLVNASYIKLRKIIPAERFARRAPFFPYLPIIGIFTKFFLAIYLYKYSPLAWYVTASWILVGLAFFYLWVRKRQEQFVPPLVPLAAPLPMAPGRQRKSFRILVLLSSPAPSTARSLAKTAGAAAQALDGEVVLLQPVLVPELTPLSEGQAFYRDRSLLDEAVRALPPGIDSQSVVRIGHNLDALVREAVRDEGAKLLLMSGQARLTVGQPTSPLLAYPPCDVAILRLKTPDVTGKKVLVTTHGQHAALGVRLAAALARASSGRITLYHAMGRHEDEAKTEEEARQVLHENVLPDVPAETGMERGPAVRKVLDKSRGYDLVVVGAPNVAPWRRSLLGPRTQEITDRVAGNVLIVRHAQASGGRGTWLGRRLIRIMRYFQPE